ncbi:MAG: hypothetical protein ABFS45_21385 [Pseudomonadota bacterium]
MEIRAFSRFAAVFSLVFIIASCGSGSSDGDSDVPPEDLSDAPPENLEGSLNALGVDTTISPRLDNRGNPYPESYSPLGSVITIREIFVPGDGDELVSDLIVGRADELFVGGIRTWNNSNSYLTVIDDIASGDIVNNETFPEILYEDIQVEPQWPREEYDGSPRDVIVRGTHRDATSADVNGNGFRETALVYVSEASGGGATAVRLRVLDATPPSPKSVEVSIPIDTRYFPIYDLRVAGGDFDNDGADEIAIAVSRQPLSGLSSTPVGIYIVDDESAGFTVIREHHVDLNTTLNEPYITLVLESVQLDHDAIAELVLVINENTDEDQTNGTYAARYIALEVEEKQLTVVSEGPIIARITGEDDLVAEHRLVVADVTGGDLDGDSVDELVFAGLEEVINQCSVAPPANGLKHALVGLGNHFNDFAQIGASVYFNKPAGCDAANPTLYRFVHANVLDFDGDGDNDIQANDFVFEGFEQNQPDAPPITVAQVGGKDFITVDGKAARFDRSNTAVAVSDQSGDGIDDIILINLLAESDSQSGLKVYAWDSIEMRSAEISKVPLFAGDVIFSDLMNPMLVPIDVDNDKIAMFQYTNEHYLDFTEPVILAVLAAAPCKRNIGQNTTDSCSTSWGSAQTGAAGRNFSVKVSGSVGYGFGGAGAGVSTKYLAKLTFEARKEISESYELTKSRTFSTGPFEDGVIFTSIPMDRYVYVKTVAKLPDDAFLFERLVVNLPRDSDMRLVTRRYFNASITNNPENAPLRIDDEVFQHVAGDLSTYPTAREKDEILAREQSIVHDRRRVSVASDDRFDPVVALGGLEVGPVAVGEGSGGTELALEYNETIGEANALELGFEFEAETLAGGAFSLSVGAAAERVLSVSHGDTTLFAGAIGSIPEENYADHGYKFGLFAYLKAMGDQEFEVINFWVEE